ncbi:MAG: phosphoribosylformylglycinamidine synthase subunit PurS [Acidimicrobiales bacterium]
MEFDVLIEVRPRKGISDPEGATIERSLPTLGFDGVRDVKVGKAIRCTIEALDEAAAHAELDDLCARFLTNPVIEDAEVSMTERGPSGPAAGQARRA